MPTGQGKGTATSPTHEGVAWSKAVVMVVQRQGPGGDGAAHHDEHDGYGAGHLVQQGQDLVGKLLLRHLTE
jgi:hypothetical protein